MKEFFEAFSIKKVRECELRDECFFGFAHTCDKCDIYGQAYEVYPPITSDIVLRLIQILSNFSSISICRQSDGRYYIKCDGVGIVGIFNETLMLLCIDLKDDIQDQVRALFNAK